MGTLRITFLFISEPLQQSFLNTIAENHALELRGKKGESALERKRRKRARKEAKEERRKENSLGI